MQRSCNTNHITRRSNLAILKHINVHNSNYHDFITYVLFQHDSHARPIYNERHKMILRENVLIDAINTTPWSYNIDCL